MEKSSGKTPKLDQRLIFLGDDTGLMKKLRLSATIVKNIISQPTVYKRRNHLKRGNEEREDHIEGENVDVQANTSEVHADAVVRDKAEITVKIADKFGKQEKDQGVMYMNWSLGQANNDYISYVRGKSNIVEVFDT